MLKNKYFMKMYDDIKNIYKSLITKDIDIKIIDEKPEKYLKDNSDNDFTSKEIKEYIFLNLKHSYKITCDNNTIIMLTVKELSVIPSYVIHMMKIIRIIKILFKNDKKQKIIYFETFKKKKFPRRKKILGTNEINTGLTFLKLDDSHHNGNIILFRKEEVIKVLIHELIHSTLTDINIILSDKNKDFSGLFCVDYDILLNEAYTETLATIINIFYIHIFNGLKKSEIDVMYNNEIRYSNYICSKIMKYYDIDNIKDIVKNNNVCKYVFPQNTNVFSYFFLKNILLIKHIEFSNILHLHSIDNKGINKIINLLMNNIDLINKNKVIIKDNKTNLKMCYYSLSESCVSPKSS